MKVSDIMKPIRNYSEIFDYIQGDVYIINIDNLNGKTSTLYVVDNENKIIGIVNKEVLQYIINKNKKITISNLMNYVDDAIVVVDLDGKIFFVNKGYTKILGVPMGNVLGKYMHDLEQNSEIINVLNTKKPIYIDNHLIKSVGKYVSLKIFPLMVGGHIEGAISIFKDVTEINNLSKEVKRITEVAKQFDNEIKFQKEMDMVGIIGDNPKYLNLILKTFTVAKTDAAVLIRGESGVGKEVFTKIIHNYSERKNKSFISVNCAAIPESLFESELFGYEEGSFTGAKRGGKIGKFELADGGTLFLDEIGDMPLLMQSKLLRVLQDGEIEKIGRQENIPVNVRIIAATNQPLEGMIKEKKFRDDLYYRLNVITLEIPPLRERGNDIILLTNHFLKMYNNKYQKQLNFSQDVYKLFVNYNWPGNIRELQNYIEYAVILCTDNIINISDLPVAIRQFVVDTENKDIYDNFEYNYDSLKDAVKDYEKKIIINTLKKHKNNKTESMKTLGLSRRTFYRKLQELNISDKK